MQCSVAKLALNFQKDPKFNQNKHTIHNKLKNTRQLRGPRFTENHRRPSTPKLASFRETLITAVVMCKRYIPCPTD